MKNRLIVMIITFLIMIGITPLVFGKLMNSKFDKMLENIKKQNISIKEIKNKSSYLSTDRVFEVIIPGDKLNAPDIEYIKTIVEAKFKNLPVTTVDFEGKVIEIKTKNLDNNALNAIIRDKIKFFVTTPDFKIYKYKIFDTMLEMNDAEIVLNGINGVYQYPSKSSLKIKNLSFIILKNPFKISITDFKNEYEKKGNEIYSLNRFNIKGNFQKITFFLNNFVLKNVAVFTDSKINGIANADFKELNIGNLIDIKNTKLNIKINGIEKEIAKKMQNASKEEKQRLILKLISKGFDINGNFKIDNIEYLKHKLGYFNLSFFLKFIPTQNIEEKINNNDLSFIKLNVNIKTTKTISNILASIEPRIALILQNAKISGNDVEINIKKEGNKFLINGKEIKSY